MLLIYSPHDWLVCVRESCRTNDVRVERVKFLAEPNKTMATESFRLVQVKYKSSHLNKWKSWRNGNFVVRRKVFTSCSCTRVVVRSKTEIDIFRQIELVFAAGITFLLRRTPYHVHRPGADRPLAADQRIRLRPLENNSTTTTVDYL